MENIIDPDFRIPYAWYPRTSDRISWEVQFHHPVKMCPSKIKIGKIAHREILFEWLSSLEVCLLFSRLVGIQINQLYSPFQVLLIEKIIPSLC